MRSFNNDDTLSSAMILFVDVDLLMLMRLNTDIIFIDEVTCKVYTNMTKEQIKYDTACIQNINM